MNTSVKTCFKCGTTKSVEEFYKHPKMADGRLNKCKACAKSDVNANRLANIEYYRAFDRARASLPKRVDARKQYRTTDAYKDARRKANQTYKSRYPERAKARNIVSRAIRNGKLLPMPCIVCGGDAEAHHPDYAKPLDVIWLCDTHHKELHKTCRAYAREELF